MPRLRVIDFRENFPNTAIGICQGDLAALTKLLNKCQRRLVFAREAGETGWWGSWAEMAFTVSQTSPSITLPRDVARLINIAVCQKPVLIQNQFYEYLDFGIGPQPRPACPSPPCGQHLESYTRNNVPTFVDLSPTNQKIRVYLTDPNDQGKRVFIGGLDNNGTVINSLDNGIMCLGQFLALTSPFIDTPMGVSKITGIQKDVTFGPVKFYQVDLTSGAQTLLLTMEAGEKVASYRRYFINGLPTSCCNPAVPGGTSSVQVTAMAKLELVEVVADSDYLLVQNLEALNEEAQSVRYSEIDNTDAKQMAQEKHVQAIRLLQGELVHYLGKNRPAIGFMNSEARGLRRVNIGMR